MLRSVAGAAVSEAAAGFKNSAHEGSDHAFATAVLASTNTPMLSTAGGPKLLVQEIGGLTASAASEDERCRPRFPNFSFSNCIFQASTAQPQPQIDLSVPTLVSPFEDVFY